MGSVLIINALSITQITVLTKKLDFKTKTKTSLLSAIISGIVGIGMAYTGFGVWALVAQVLSKQTIYTIGLWFSIVGGLTSASTKRTLNICGDSDRN